MNLIPWTSNRQTDILIVLRRCSSLFIKEYKILTLISFLSNITKPYIMNAARPVSGLYIGSYLLPHFEEIVIPVY